MKPLKYGLPGLAATLLVLQVAVGCSSPAPTSDPLTAVPPEDAIPEARDTSGHSAAAPGVRPAEPAPAAPAAPAADPVAPAAPHPVDAAPLPPPEALNMPAETTREELLGLAIPAHQLDAEDFFEKYGLGVDQGGASSNKRKVLSSFGAITGPIRGLTAAQIAAFRRGGDTFGKTFMPQEGQGPYANAFSCASCHQLGGIAGAGHEAVTRMALVDMRDPNWMMNSNGYYDMTELGGPVQQAEGAVNPEALPDLVDVNVLADNLAKKGVTVGRNVVTSTRVTPNIAGDGLLSAIPDSAIKARAALVKPFGITGHANELSGVIFDQNMDGRVGRLGHKAQLPDNRAFFADAAQQELGMTNPDNPFELDGGRLANKVAVLDFNQDQANDFEAFCMGLAPPAPAAADAAGQRAFFKAGCAVCHFTGYFTERTTANLPPHMQPFAGALAGKPVPSYSDLLVHNMGRNLADGFKMGTAVGAEWRTAPLWGLRFKEAFLHDGRALTVQDAIELHFGEGSEANQVIENYLGTSTLNPTANLNATERAALLEFLKKL